MDTEMQSEFTNRMKFLPELDHSMGPSFTLGKHAMRALQKSSPEKVNWDDVHKKVIVESIEKHGQDADDVFDAITKFSPGAIRPEVQEKLRTTIDAVAPELSRIYDQVRAKEDAEAEAEKRANGGVIKFKK
jgi:hypothetical protein